MLPLQEYCPPQESHPRLIKAETLIFRMPVGILSRRNAKPKSLAHHSLARQVIGVLWFALYIVATLALFSYDPGDLSFNVNPPNTVPTNFIGYVGAGLAWFLYVGFGFGAYLICVLFLVGALINFMGTDVRWRWKPLWIVLLLVSFCCLLDLQNVWGQEWIRQRANVTSPGGLVGSTIIQFVVPYALGRVGAGVLFGTISAISAIYLFNFNPILTALGAFSFYRRWVEEREERRLAQAPPQERLARESQRIRRKMDELHRQAALDPISPAPSEPATIRRPDDELIPEPEPETEPVAEEDEPEEPVPKSKPAKITRPPAPAKLEPAPATPHDNYQLPTLSLLSLPSAKAREAGLSDAQLRKNLDLIIETLRVFGVKATAGEITPGATITRYEVYPGEGVRVDKIKSLGKDLSRVLCAERINILAPIPGRDSVGIEIPNSNKVSVFLRELLESRDWAGTAAKIPIALGKDVYGKTLVADLAAMPHMLIGGTTGSGKSVCINCILMSFLYRFSPDDLRLILIDPKQVEMQVYNTIPHLVVPVVTDPKKVMLALRWVINEMEDRYRILAKVGVRNIGSFNSRPPTTVAPSPQLELNVPDAGDEDEDGPDETPDAPIRVPRDTDVVIPAKLPYIVVIIDELADLMQTAPADVESAVARLTAKARAAGIHLIVATQTPRREVVTGVIKTNIPARMAFQVPSGLDSRVILDENGAENLLGRGDLLYRPPGVGRLTRGQGAFVSDEEVQDVVKFCAAQGEAQFVAEIHNKLSGKAPAGLEISEADRELIIEAFEVIRQEKRASTSNLQRRMRLGYNRAAYVIDYLEKVGVLAPGEGAKPREILVDLETYNLDF
jgi:S-DNA-T family DNA segregation ATPase FtsK/SpoIIIE